MADEQSDYKRGTMPVDAQTGTFNGFMAGSTYGGALIVVILLFPILVYAANLPWMPSLVGTIVVGIILGLALKLKGAWYASIVGLGIVTGLMFALITSFT